MPAEEIPSHSDSEVSGGSPPDRTCSNSETSSGVHSNSSRDSENTKLQLELPTSRAAASIFGETHKIHPQQWIQRNIIHSPPPYNNTRVYKPQQHYAVANKTPVINEVAEESTVVIRRKNSTNVKSPALVNPNVAGDRFSRSTNMRMTSFTDHPPEQSKQSATLPHYPTTQPVGFPYQYCSTMPLPASNTGCSPLSNGGSCGSFPRPHTTIPTHHNGVRLCAPTSNPYAKFPLPVHHGYPGAVDSTTNLCALKASHHTFPQLPVHPVKYCLQRNVERDSANFSIGSSGDSDVCNTGTVVS